MATDCIAYTHDQPNERVSITVCVPVYNVKEYLRECLDSLFSQDYPSFDVVMVDDGSTDGSGDICDEYATTFAGRARVVHWSNQGTFLARREAISKANGDYIMCVDSDDMLLPGALSAVSAAIERTHADVVLFGFTRVRDELCRVSAEVPMRAACCGGKVELLQSLCRSTDGSQNPMAFKAVRRECIADDENYSKLKGLTFAEDFLQTLFVYDRSDSFCFLDAPLYYYRPGSGITKSYDPHFYRAVCRCLDYAEGFAANWERRYHCSGLLAGLAACRLDSAAQYAEYIAKTGGIFELNELSASEDFVRCLKVADLRLLRWDRRIAIFAIRHQSLGLLKSLSLARSLRHSK